MKDKLDAKIMQRVDRYYRTKKEVEAVYVNCNGVADKINASNVTKTWPRNLNPFTCQGCRIRSYCLADLRGHDTEFLARTEYMREGEQPFYSSVEFLEDTDGQE
jgi:hypothetical protein